jgi:hypothetical protein
MWAVLGNGGEGFGGELKPVVKPAERKALLQAGLITVEKRARSFWLEVTDRGWRWAGEHLGDELPAKSQAGTFVLRAWLTRLQAFMKVRGFGLAEVLGPQPAEKFDAGGDKRTDGEPAVTPRVEYPKLRERIRQAYLDITGGSFNKRALLSDIRGRLPGLDREALDDALKRMQREEDASLMQLDNQVEITDADRTAALHIGNEPRHILWISR